MNKSVTSREKIIEECKKIVMEDGLNGINIRKVASKCNTAIGSIYYYFPSKSTLITTTIENIWFEIFHMSNNNNESNSFIDYIQNTFVNVKNGVNKYPNFFTLHSISFAAKNKEQGEIVMDKYLNHMKKGLLLILNNDPNIKKDAFNNDLTKESFIDLIFSLSISMMLQKNYDTKSICELIRKIIY